ncbi:alpha-ketoglutarate-dependent dioxygenase AlkB [Pedobacter sp. GR22-10]|uniref:alpha-ketoglutarate-dependent dioxygenase AlkB n=1 Tax=Pedobacter sp. GR22-10 TaxID=2994472 RepID=UPI0022461B99|nr:alpha-ketoglutarate-dependent dioxygenase AlkB [Pedobacter sp. GR22-10]MCX2430657.1 alpha-ketoglutarate-dependent dioxygenase AlkB [Pedobacter sp. GR22-10]
MKPETIFDLFNPAPEVFPVSPNLEAETAYSIEGLKYVPNFISVEEEQTLIERINSENWLGDLKRRVQHYGWKYDYKARKLDYGMYLGLIPDWIQLLAERLVSNEIMKEVADQVIINEYKPGQGIANHVDCEPCFGDTVISISLAAPCIMNFINLKTKEKREALLEPRSAVAIQGAARYSWSHGIPARLADEINGNRVNRLLRISMTFRKVIF